MRKKVWPAAGLLLLSALLARPGAAEVAHPAGPRGSAPAASGDATAPKPSLTTVLLVRHAERDTMFLGTDMPLAAAGRQRAQELARVLEEAGVSAIYVTRWRRNRETAAPLAAALGESLQVLEGRDFEAQARVLRAHRGATVAVIGHGDTVPQLHEALTGAKWRGFRSGEWDVILLVTLGPGGAWKTVPIKYGAVARGRPAE